MDREELMKFNKGKCKFLHQRKNKSVCQYRLESSSAEKYLGVLVDKKLSQQCAVAANKATSLLGCNGKSTASRMSCLSALVRPCLEYCVQCQASQYYKRDINILEQAV